MVVTIDAVLPVQPIRLPPNTRVQISVTAEEQLNPSFLDVAEALALEGPPDWSRQLDEYLYGSQTRNGQ